jgi:hypothetical protein
LGKKFAVKAARFKFMDGYSAMKALEWSQWVSDFTYAQELRVNSRISDRAGVRATR